MRTTCGLVLGPRLTSASNQTNIACMTSIQSKGGLARADALTPKKRSAIARKAAKARWENTDVRQKSKTARKSAPRAQRNTFGEALYEAQHQLAEAVNQLAYHQQEYNRLRTEIPNLQRMVNALQAHQGQTQEQYRGPQINYYPQGYAPSQGPAPLPPDYSLDTILSDQPLPTDQPTNAGYPNPPSMTFVMPPPPPAIPAHAPTPSMVEMPRPPLPPRGGGGAIGKPLEDENENQFLDEAERDLKNAAGGGWK